MLKRLEKNRFRFHGNKEKGHIIMPLFFYSTYQFILKITINCVFFLNFIILNKCLSQEDKNYFLSPQLCKTAKRYT